MEDLKMAPKPSYEELEKELAERDRVEGGYRGRR